MRILVIGAAGRTGRLIVERALGHGHDVTGLVHGSVLELNHPQLTVVRGDVTDLESVRSVIDPDAAVALAVGGGSGGLHEQAAANVIYAMAEQGARRLAVMSAAGTFARSDKALSIGYRALVATALRATYDDLEAMERRVMASDLDWTIVRPVGLTDGPATGDYRVSLDGSIPPKVSRISRADVAAVLLKALETDTYWRRTVVIAD